VPQQTDGIMRGAGILAAFTFLSRVLGLVRDALSAALFGAGATWDAFSFAFRVPNMLRRLLGEGALSAAFIPMFAGRLEAGDREGAAALAGRIAGVLTVLLGVLIVAAEGIVLTLLVFANPNEQWRLALGLTAVLLPYMLPICLAALLAAVLNSLRHFTTPALAPVTLNLVWILAVGFVAPAVSSDPIVRIYIVAAGILLAGLLQLALQVGGLRAERFVFAPVLAPAHSDVRRLARAMGPVALGMAAVQLNLLLDGVIALSLAGPEDGAALRLFGAVLGYPMRVGANSVLYYGNRLMQLPLGVFGIAIATAAFPALSRHAAREDRAAFAASLRRSLGLVVFVAAPSGVGLIVLREPIIALVFRRGAFTAAMADRTAAVTLAYSTAVWAYCAVHVLSRAFYALGRAGTPAAVAAVAVLANLALNLTLVWPLAEAGLAAATAVSAVLQVAVLWWLLQRAGMTGDPRRLLGSIGKTLLATGIMAGACLAVLGRLPAAWSVGSLGLRCLRVVLPTAAGGSAFVAAAAVLRAEELHETARRMFRRTSSTR